MAGWSQVKRYLILVIVSGVVRSQTYEYRYVAVLKSSVIRNNGFCMGEHLYALVFAQVKCTLLVDTTGLACSQSHYLKAHGLLIILYELDLVGVQYTCHAGRNHIVYR